VRLARVALVIELVGLVAILWQVNSPWPAIALLIYVVFAAVKSRMWNLAIVVTCSPTCPRS
jgi:hypothetical protein